MTFNQFLNYVPYYQRLFFRWFVGSLRFNSLPIGEWEKLYQEFRGE